MGRNIHIYIGGRPVAYPAWIDTAIGGGWAVNTWAQISGSSPSYGLSSTNNINAVIPSDASSRGDASSVCKSWCGGAFAKNAGSFGKLIAWGGGHGDYCGNEVYGFDVSTRTWSRLSEAYSGASLPFSGLTTGWWPAEGAQVNGSPAVIHTYDMVEYHPSSNTFWTFFGQTGSGANTSTPRPGAFSLATNVWAQKTLCPYTQALEGWTTYDSTRDTFIIHGAAGVSHTVSYSVAGDSYTQYTQADETWAQITDTVGAYDPVNDFHCAINPSNGNMYGLDAGNLSSDAVNLTTSGKPTITAGGGFEYCASLGCFVWHSGSGANVYTVTKGSGSWQTATWTWAQVTAGGNTVTPEANESAGVYSKFRIAEYTGKTIALCVKRTGATGTGAVYAFRFN